MKTKLPGLVLAVVVGMLAPTTVSVVTAAPAVAANCADCDPGPSAGGGTSPAGSPGLCPTSGIVKEPHEVFLLSHCWVNVVGTAQILGASVLYISGLIAFIEPLVTFAAGMLAATILIDAINMLGADKKCGYRGARVVFDYMGGSSVRPLC